MQHAVNGRVDGDPIRDIGFDEPKPVIVGELIDVLQRTSDQVVDADDFVAVAEEPFAKMRPKKPAAPSDENSRDTVAARSSDT
jgi:hypothetical protein